MRSAAFAAFTLAMPSPSPAQVAASDVPTQDLAVLDGATDAEPVFVWKDEREAALEDYVAMHGTEAIFGTPDQRVTAAILGSVPPIETVGSVRPFVEAAVEREREVREARLVAFVAGLQAIPETGSLQSTVVAAIERDEAAFLRRFVASTPDVPSLGPVQSVVDAAVRADRMERLVVALEDDRTFEDMGDVGSVVEETVARDRASRVAALVASIPEPVVPGPAQSVVEGVVEAERAERVAAFRPPFPDLPTDPPPVTSAAPVDPVTASPLADVLPGVEIVLRDTDQPDDGDVGTGIDGDGPRASEIASRPSTPADIAPESVEQGSATPEPGIGTMLRGVGPEDATRIDVLLDRGKEAFGQVDLDSARSWFSRAADLGSPEGAEWMARTYDPEEIVGMPLLGASQADPDRAREWRDRAAALRRDGG